MPELWTGQLLSQQREIVSYRSASLRKLPPCQTAFMQRCSTTLARMISFLKKDHSYLTWSQKLPKRAAAGPITLLLQQLAHNWSLTPQCLYQLLGISSVHFHFAFSQIFSLSVSSSLLGIVKRKSKHPINNSKNLVKTAPYFVTETIYQAFQRLSKAGC